MSEERLLELEAELAAVKASLRQAGVTVLDAGAIAGHGRYRRLEFINAAITDRGDRLEIDVIGGAGSFHSILSARHTDTLAAVVSRGSMLVGNSTLAWAELVVGAAAQYLRSNGSDAAWSAILDADLPASIARDSELHAEGHKARHLDGGADAFVSGDALRASTWYLGAKGAHGEALVGRIGALPYFMGDIDAGDWIRYDPTANKWQVGIGSIVIFEFDATRASLGKPTKIEDGAGGTGPVASAILELRDTTKGFLPPRMTTTQRDAIGSPATGLLIWNTTDKKFQQYDGTSWAALYTDAEARAAVPYAIYISFGAELIVGQSYSP